MIYDDFQKTINEFDQQLAVGLELGKRLKIPKKYRRMTVCGMGASSAIAEVLQDLKLPVVANRAYQLPYDTTRDDLIVLSSTSGGTEETLYCLKEVLDRKLNCWGIGFGGKLEEYAQKYGFQFVKIPKPFAGLQPRWTYGYQLGVYLSLTLPLPTGQAGTPWGGNNATPLATEWRGVGGEVVGRIPIIHGPSTLSSLARLWKIELAEDSQRPAFYNNYSEVNHHETTSFSHWGEKFANIILQDPDDHPQILKRQQVCQALMEKAGLKVVMIKLKGETSHEKVIYGIKLAMQVGLELAKYYKTDPSKLAFIKELKKRINHGDGISISTNP